MFAPPVAKPKSARPQRSAVAARGLCAGVTWNKPGVYENEFDTERVTGREAAPSWEFGKIPVFSSSRSDRFQMPHLFPASGLSAPIQAKFKVGVANDPLEHEADCVADRATRMPAASVSVAPAQLRVSRNCAAREEEEKRQKNPPGPQAGGSEAPPIVHQVLRSPGQPLDATTRTYFEPRFGQDFSRVRVHTDAHAAESARIVDARAYTLDSDIVFAAGAFSPTTSAGRRLLAHELVHIAQRRDGVAPQMPSVSSPADVAEREADASAEAALAGRRMSLTARPQAGQVLRDTKEYQTAGIALDPVEMATWSTRSYWEQKVFAVLAVSMTSATNSRLAAAAEERDAVFSVLWNTYQSLKPIKSEISRPVTIPARGASAPVLSYLFTFRPPAAGKDTRDRVSVSFEAEGTGAPATAAPAAAAGATAPASYSVMNFPNGNNSAAWFAKFPSEERQLYTFLAGPTIPAKGQLVTTSSTIGKKLHETTFSVIPGSTGPVVKFLAESTPTTGAPPAGYTGHDYGDLKLEEAGKDKALLGKITLPAGMPAGEAIPLKYTIWQYFQGGTRNAEVDAIVPIPGTPPKRVFYTLKFHGGTNAVDVVRIGEEGTAGTVALAKITFDLARIPNYPAHSKDVSALSSWLKTRYPAITPAGADVTAMKSAAEKDIESEAVKKDWFKNNYGMEELDKAGAATRLASQGWDPPQVKDTKDFVPDERRLLERAFETLSDRLLALLVGVPLARQTVFMKKGGTPKAPTYTPDPKTAGDTVTQTTTVGGKVTKVDRTLVFFDSWFTSDQRLFIGGTGTVAPASIETPLHEFGHVVGAQAGIKDAFEKKFTAAKAVFKTAPITWYAKSDAPKEFFAEAFALFHADPEWMQTNLPNMFAWFQTLSSTGKPPP